MIDERIAKLEKAMEDKSFEEKVAMCNSEDEFKSLLSQNGIDFSSDEIKAICSNVRSNLSGDELHEDSLDDVSGGGFFAGLAIVGGAYLAGRLYGRYAGKKLGYCW